MKKIIFLLVCALFLRSLSLSAQSWQWARQNTGGYQKTNFTTWGINNPQVTADAFGNVYMFGTYTSPTISFGTYTVSNTDICSVFLVKYDSNGNEKWLRGFGGWDQASSVVTDASGNVYITGASGDSTLFFDTFTLHKPALASTIGMFLIKYDSLGNFIWAKTAGGDGAGGGISLSIDVAGYIYVTGNGNFDTVIFDNDTLVNAPIFIAKYDALGNVKWAKGINYYSMYGMYNANPVAITTDDSCNIIVTGQTRNAATYFGSLVLPTVGDTNYTHIFIAKYDSSGNVLWAKCAGGNSYDLVFSVITDIANCIYILCSCGSCIFDSSSISDASLIKCDWNGNIIWSRNASPYVTTSIAKDAFNNIYSSNSSFIIKYDTSGSMIWNETVGENTSCIAANSISNVYIVGLYQDSTASFGGITLYNPNPPTSGYYPILYSNIYLAKLENPGAETTSTIPNKINTVLAYPNPSTGNVTIDLSKFDDNEKIIVTDISGKIIEENEILIKKMQLNLANYPCGEYIINIIGNSINYQSKIIIK